LPSARALPEGNIKPMLVLIACDSFKDALPAAEVCRAIAKGIKRAHPQAVITEIPLSDGGEGVLEVLRRALALRTVTITVEDPLGRPIKASYGLSSDGRTALVEMAKASGLELLTQAERDPLRTSTYGTGQLLADAAAQGARRILLAIGGSATNDGGVGAAMALGWQFRDADGNPVKPSGGKLKEIARIVPPAELPFGQVDVLCDVTNPLYGPKGASWTYGRQKGGTDQSLAYLDDALRHVAGLVERANGRKGLADMPGAGAAGGLGFGAMAFMNGRLRRGADMVMELVGFDDAAAKADLVITGEGRIDGQSAQGKLISGVCAHAGKTPVVALCGKLDASDADIHAIGLKAVHVINDGGKPLKDMLAETAADLENAAAKIVLA
jgi:glycerate kinase